jgi:hypothetical protein
MAPTEEKRVALFGGEGQMKVDGHFVVGGVGSAEESQRQLRIPTRSNRDLKLGINTIAPGTIP